MKSWEAASLQSGSAVAAESDLSARAGFVAVTGSRDIDRATARHLFEQHLSSRLHQGRTWVLAGARGLDQWAIEWLREHHEVCWVVVPYTIGDQPRWAQTWLAEVDRVVELQLPRRKSAGAFRNRYLVDLSQVVFGFWSGKGGGTIKTLRSALRRRREVHGIPVTGADASD
jgi:predicted Rossmann fold nucleotide-binding protein DprA/Smf involved in DNA uptake